ncbi:MAG: RDD family protein, partial [Lachnospiraceae bacterium]|nr:RDD family protein [Lachnospiraceae bacterium]
MYFDIQRASMLKRISALILDFILVMILATGFGSLISGAIGYDASLNKLNAMSAEYEEKYGINLSVTPDDYAGLTEEEKAVYSEANEAMLNDENISSQYSLLINKTLIVMTFGILLAMLVSDLVVPLLFKNGQTVGKKIFSLAVMNQDQTKLTGIGLT